MDLFYDQIKKLEIEDYLKQNIIDELKDKLHYFYDRIFAYLARIVDLYFMRRFLDKDYITNAIVYTGATHSLSYIYILRKLGFKITHCANCPIKDISELNKKVLDVKNFPFEESIFELFDLFLTEDQIQCSNISDFPKKFE